MDLAAMNVLFNAPPVTKAWISSVIVVSALSYFEYIDINQYAHFTSYRQLISTPWKILVSLCYCGELNVIKFIDIYQILGFLTELERLHSRSATHFLKKIGSMLVLILVFHQLLPLLIAPRIFGFDFIFPRETVNKVYNEIFINFSLWNLLIMNFIYYKSRFEGLANFNNWFNVHPVLLYLLNFFTIASRVNWRTLLLFILPGHMLYYLDTIIPRLYKHQSNKVFAVGILFSFIFWIFIAEGFVIVYDPIK